MAQSVGGQITWILDADSSKLDKGLSDASSKARSLAREMDSATRSTSNSLEAMAGKASQQFGGIADSILGILKPLAILGVTGSVGLGGLVKFGFDATREVQKTTAGIISLTGSADAAGKVISEMISYVQGKPFDRLEVIQASRQLLAMGRTTSQLTGDIDLLGKAVILTGGDFSSLAQIYGQAASSNRVMSGELNQLESTGIPITQKLGQAMGITAGQVREMAEKGQIDFATFKTALELALPADIVANASNTIDNKIKSLTASFRNLAFDILGVDFSKMDGQPLIMVGGLLDKVTTAIDDVIKKLRAPEMRETFKNIGDQIGSVVQSVLPKLIDGMIFLMLHLNQIIIAVVAFGAAWAVFKGMQIMSTIIQVGAGIASMVGVLASATSGLGFMAAAQQILNIAMTANPIGVIVVAITALIALFVILQLKFNIFGKAFEGIKKIVEPLMPLFNTIKDFVVGQLVSAFDSLKRIWEQLATSMQPLIAMFKEFWSQHGEKVMQVLKFVAIAIGAVILAPLIIAFGVFIGVLKIITTVLKFVADNFDKIKNVIMIVGALIFGPLVLAVMAAIKVFNMLKDGVFALGNFITTAWNAIYTAVSTAITSIFNIITIVWNAIMAFISPILNFIMNLFIIVWGSIFLAIYYYLTFIFNIVMTIWNAIWGFIQPILMTIWGFISGVWNAIVGSISVALNFIWTTIMNVWNAIWAFIAPIVQGIAGFLIGTFNGIYRTLVGIFNGILGVARNVWNSISGTITGAINNVRNFFAGAGGWLYGAGRDIIQGLINGVANMAGAIFGKAQEIANGVKDRIKNALRIGSPSKVMIGFGTNVGEGLAIGMQKSMPDINAMAGQLAGGIDSGLKNIESSAVQMSVSAQGQSLGDNAFAAPTNNTDIVNNINGNIMLGDESAVNTFFARLNRNGELAAKGMTTV